MTVEDIVRSRGSYIGYLGWMRRGSAPVLEGLDWSRLGKAALPDLEARRARYERLDEDLRQLGVEIEALSPRPVPNPAVEAGGLYVLEGSIHGSAEIARGLRSRPELAGLPTGFVDGFGPEGGRMWGAFVRWLAGLDFGDEEIEASAEAAEAAFARFVRELSPSTQS